MATLKQMVCNFNSENTNTLLLSVKELCSVREIGRKTSKVFSNATQQTVSHWIWTIGQARPGLKYNQFNSATNNGHKQWPQTMVQTRQKTTIKWTRNSLKKISATGDISVSTLRNQRIKFVFGKLGATILSHWIHVRIAEKKHKDKNLQIFPLSDHPLNTWKLNMQ